MDLGEVRRFVLDLAWQHAIRWMRVACMIALTGPLRQYGGAPGGNGRIGDATMPGMVNENPLRVDAQHI
jgi:hypothetical protein